MQLQLLLLCLDVDQFHGIFELSEPSQLQSPWKGSAWLYILICSFSQQTFIEDTFCAGCWRQKGEQDTDRTGPNTQTASSLVEKSSRFWLDWAPYSLARGCQRGRRSCIDELVSFLNWCNTYKIHILCLLEDFDEMATTIPLKGIIISPTVYWGPDAKISSFSALSPSSTGILFFPFHR